MMKSRLYRIAAIILLVGLTASVLIYLTAEKTEENTLIAEFQQSKRFRHDMEQTGGKLILVGSEFMNWFEGLWKGQTLAFTLAGLSIFVSGVLFLIAKTSPPEPGENGPKHGAHPSG
jgi:hypothetical protein